MNVKTYFLDYDFQDSFLIYSKKAVQGQLPLGIRLSEKIENNKQKVKNFIGANQILMLHQTHSNLVIDSDEHDLQNNDFEPEADGAVASKPGVALTIRTADCVAALLYCDKSKIIGAAHCGWRGSKNGLIQNIAAKMKSKGAAGIKAIISPAIAQQSYQVGEELYEEFCQYDKNSKKFFIPDTARKFKFDLPSMVAYELEKCDIQIASKSSDDTFTNLKYPSYRRDMARGRESYDRMLSCIIIKE